MVFRWARFGPSRAGVLGVLLLLGAVQEDGAVRAGRLASDLGSPDPAEREGAFEDLKKLGEAARPALLAARGVQDQEVSSRASFLLARLDAAAKCPQAALRPELLDLLAREGPAGWGRIFIGLAGRSDMRRRDLDRLVPLAFERLRKEDLGEIVKAAGRGECRAVLPYLVRCLSSDDLELRQEAAHGLQELGGYEVEKDLVRLLEDPRSEVRQAARNALHGIFGPDAHALFVPLLRDPADQTVGEVLDGLRDDSPRATMPPEAIEALLSHSSKEIQYQAIEILGRWRSSSLGARLKKFLGDPDSSLRQAAARAARTGELRECLPALRPLLDDPDADVRAEVLESLLTLGDRESIPKMIAILRDVGEKAVVRVAAAEALRSLKVKEAGPLGISLLGHEDAGLRREAALLVGETVGPSALRELSGLLRDPDGQTREAVASLLENWKSRETVEAVDPALGDLDSEIRKTALTLLGSLGGAGTAERIGGRLEDPDPQVQNSAAWALVSVQSPDLAPWLRKLLKNKEALIRSRALERLWQGEGTAAADLVVELLSDPEEDVRRTAVEILGMAGREKDLAALALALADPAESVSRAAKGALSRRFDRPDRAKILELLPGATPETRERALRDLPLPGLERSVEEIAGSLAQQSFSVWRQAFVELGRRGPESSVAEDVLLAILEKPEFQVRDWAVEFLALAGRSRSIRSLRALLSNPDASVRGSAAVSLAALGDLDSAEAIAKLLEGPEDEGRHLACRALGMLGRKDRAGALKAMLGEVSVELEAFVVEALAMMDATDAAPQIVLSLENLRGVSGGTLSSGIPKASEALGRLGGRDVVPDLLGRLKSRFAPIRADAAAALGALGAREAVPTLVSLLEDHFPFVRGEAAKALGRLESPEAIPGLRRLLARKETPPFEEAEEGSGAAKVQAVRALARLGAREAAPDLVELLKSGYEDLRIAAFEAIGRLRLKEAVPAILAIVSNPGLYGENGIPMRPEGSGRVPGTLGFSIAWTGTSGAWASVFLPDLLADLGATEYVPDLVRRLPWVASTERLSTAAAIVRLGSREGVAAILQAAEWGDPSALWSLNALRNPTAWGRLRDLPFRGTRSWTKAGVFGDVGKALGMPVDVPPRGWWGTSDGVWEVNPTCGLEYAAALEAEGTMVGVLRSLCGVLYSFILDEDRLRVVRNEEAVAFWREWWKGQDGKK
jgi:HEAT repeat protein